MANTERLLAALKDEEASARRMACEEICEQSDAVAFVDTLAEALCDADHGVSEAAMNALVNIGGHEVAAAVAPLLRNSEARFRNRAIEILISSGSASTPIVSEMLEDGDDDVVKFAVDILAGTGDASTSERVAELIKHPNANVRGAVALYMGMAQPFGATQYIMAAISDSEQWVRFSGVEALGLLGDIRHLEPLLEIVREESGAVREAAVDALSRMATTANSYEILMTMRDSMKDDAFIPVFAIVGILEKAAHASWNMNKFDTLKEMLFRIFDSAVTEPELDKRMSALRGFVLLNDSRGIKRVMEFMDSFDELDEDMEEYVLSTFVELCSGRDVPAEVFERIKKGGKNTLTLIKFIGRLKSVEALPALSQCLEHCGRDEARAILFAVEEIGAADSEELLYKAIYSSDGHVRKIAARTLARVAGDKATDNLFAMIIKEKYRDVIEEVTDSLAAIASENVRTGFINLIRSEREDLREMGCRGLGGLGGDSSVEPLEGALEDSDLRVRKMAYVSLAMLGVPRALEAVIKGLALGDEEISIAIMDSLNAVKTDELKEALRDRLGDSSLWVRYHAVTLLGEMLDREAEDKLLEMLRNDEPPVRAAAAGALASMVSDKALPILKSMYEEADASMRCAIEKAIEEIGC